MRIALLVVAALLSPLLVVAIVAASGPSWALWPSAVFAALLLLAVATQWLTERKPPIAWLVPLALMLVAVVAVALASPGATSWILWPVLVAALVAIAAGLADISDRRPKRAASS